MFSIQNATIADIPLIRDLTYKIWPQTYAPILSTEKISYMLDMMYSEASLQKQMEEGCWFIIVYEGDEPVGFAAYQETAPRQYKLHKIYVLPSQQGKGTGRFLIDHILSVIKQLGAQSLELQVNRQNKAKGFYEKLGFMVTREMDLDIGGGHFMNDYIMVKNL
ncbi:MAG: GNAT family N-acetyltransferase [Chitinophagaceae bacterium]